MREHGQFERTLIIVDEGAYVHYVEGCTAADLLDDSLHSAVVEIMSRRMHAAAIRPSRTGTTTSTTSSRKRAVATRGDHGVGRWEPGLQAHHEVPGDLADGERAHGESSRSRSPARGSTRTRAARPVHVAPNTTSVITSKSISKNGGRAGYAVCSSGKGRARSKSKVVCDRPDPRRRDRARTRTRT